MTRDELKLECLKLAIGCRRESYTAKNIVESAEKFLKFVEDEENKKGKKDE